MAANRQKRLAVAEQNLIARKPSKLAAVALANKMARMAWKMMTSAENYRPPSGAASAAS